MKLFSLGNNISVMLMCCLFLFSSVSQAEEPKFTNAGAKFKPMAAAEEAALEKSKLGIPPKLSSDALAKISKGKVILREVKGQGEARSCQAIAVVKAPPAKVMAFLRDYPSYVKYMPHLKDIKVSWNGNMATNSYQLKIALTNVAYKLNILHYGNSALEWEYISGDIRDTNGYYHLHPFNDGQWTLVDYNVYTDPGMPIPQFIINLLTRNSMPDVIEAIRKAVADRFGLK